MFWALIITLAIGIPAGIIIGYLTRKPTDNPLFRSLAGAALGAAAAVLFYTFIPKSYPKTPNMQAVDSREEFNEVVLQADKPVLVDFYATWCPPCKKLAPRLDELAAEFGDSARFVKVDADKNPDLVQEYEVGAYPTVFIFVGGEVAHRLPGVKPKNVYATRLMAATKLTKPAPAKRQATMEPDR
ncbi:MAG: thioredoxin family protein [Phycisphaerae bacterium]